MRLVVEHLSDMPPLAVLEGHLSAFAGVSGRADALLRRPDLHTVVAYTRTRGMTIESYLDDTLVGRAQIDAVDTDEWCLKHLDGARGMGCDPRIIAETN